MKNLSVSCLMIFLVAVTFINGCKKDDTQYVPVSKGNYSGNYSFTTIFFQTPYYDTTMLYDGYIGYDDISKHWTIKFLSNEEIYPTIDTNGVMTCPELVNQSTGYSFSGNIDYDGNIHFLLKHTIIHFGETYISSYTVTGKKNQER